MSADDFDSLDEFALLPADAAEFGLPWRGSPAVRRVTVLGDGRPVSALRWGTRAPDVVLLHGAALNAHTWDVFALAARYPLLAPDLPGHGESAWREDGRYGPQDIAPAVADVVEHVRAAAPVTVVGQSLGGLTAIALAAARPDLVGRLVLVDVLPSVGHAGQVRSFLAGREVFSSRAEIVARARAFGFGHSDAAVARGVWHNTRVRADGSVVWKHHLGNLDRRFSGLDRNGDPASKDDLKSTTDLEPSGGAIPSDFAALWPALEAFGGPVLLVRGERGFLPASAAHELRSWVPGAEVREVPTGHNVQEDDPVLLAEIVRGFLADTGAQQGRPAR